jgi:hypothetical protein
LYDHCDTGVCIPGVPAPGGECDTDDDCCPGAFCVEIKGATEFDFTRRCRFCSQTEGDDCTWVVSAVGGFTEPRQEMCCPSQACVCDSFNCATGAGSYRCRS